MVHQAQMGPCKVLGAPMETDDDGGGVGVSRRGTSTGVCLLTTITTPLLLLLHTTCPSKSLGVGPVRERGASRVGRPNAGGARSLARHELSNACTSSWVPASSGGRLPGSGCIAGGLPFSGEGCPVDGGLIAYVRAAPCHTTSGRTARRRGCRGA
jgi:hypothetical protein